MLSKVTRVEVIDERGRSVVCHADEGSVGLELAGNTLSIIIKRTNFKTSNDEHRMVETEQEGQKRPH